MGVARDEASGLRDRLDSELLPALYAACSLDTAQIKAELEGLPYADLAADHPPPLHVLDLTADAVIASAQRRAAGVGAVTGFAGAAGVPPEVVAAVVQVLRLGQRLAVVYGVDLDSDAGKLRLWKAVSAAFGVEVPQQGSLGLRVRDLPGSMDVRRAGAWVLRKVGARAVQTVAGQVLRLIPGFSTGMGAWSAHARLGEQGMAMKVVLRRAADEGGVAPGLIEEAIELR